MHKPYLYIPTAEERCIVRRWTWRVLIIYGAFVLTAFGLLSLSQHFGQGSKDLIAADVTAPTSGRNQSTVKTHEAATNRCKQNKLQRTPQLRNPGSARMISPCLGSITWDFWQRLPCSRPFAWIPYCRCADLLSQAISCSSCMALRHSSILCFCFTLCCFRSTLAKFSNSSERTNSIGAATCCARPARPGPSIASIRWPTQFAQWFTCV